ncbi:hypothetical protein HYH02_010482 [Chlamydomonas schloesseri]|uniref:Uncharacterized protein n=1 Tax=Chlamydomonas schloesseri TaxID=2026947 RepID=A0A835TLD1_9CHLO|nr:hypothetical protein HYH02_010482 [Chlamydomonas schloesseri]|eukprot:KAG2439850.1 hypothetical protein HYH02_010482 [Chlamydomonas schloesseri]
MRGLLCACLPGAAAKPDAPGVHNSSSSTAPASGAVGGTRDVAAAAAAALSRGDAFAASTPAAATTAAAAQLARGKPALTAPGTPGSAPAGGQVVNLTATTPRAVARTPTAVPPTSAAIDSPSRPQPPVGSDKRQHLPAPRSVSANSSSSSSSSRLPGTADWLGPVQMVRPAATAAAAAATASGPIQLCPLDHGMMLTCLNPKVLWLPYDLDYDLLAAALRAALADFPMLAGRLLPVAPASRARRLAARRTCAFHIHPPTCEPDTSTTDPTTATVAAALSTAARPAGGKGSSSAGGGGYGGAALRQATSSAAPLASFLPLAALARSGFSQLGASRQLPPYCEPLDVEAALRGQEPLLKVRLTHLLGAAAAAAAPPPAAAGGLTTGQQIGNSSGHHSSRSGCGGGGDASSRSSSSPGAGGCILAFTMHHAVLDGRSAHLFLDRLAAHYRRLLLLPQPQPQPPADRGAGEIVAAGGACGSASSAGGGGVDGLGGGAFLAPPAMLLQSLGLAQQQLQHQALPPPLPQGPSPPLQPALTEVADIRTSSRTSSAGSSSSSSSSSNNGSSSATCGSSSPAFGKLPTLTTTSSALAAAAAATASAGVTSTARHSGGAGGGGGGSSAASEPLHSSAPADRDGSKEAAALALPAPPPPAAPLFDRSRLFPPGWEPAGPRHGGAAPAAVAAAPRGPLLRGLELQHIPGADGSSTAGATSTSARTRSPCRAPASASLAGWGAALSAAGRLVRSVVAEERRGLRGASGRRLACEVLHIPRDQVAALKALASGCGCCCPSVATTPATGAAAASGATASSSTAISTNDAVTALVWLVMAELRGRPLPGAREQQQQQQQPGRRSGESRVGGDGSSTNSNGSGRGGAAAAAVGGYIGVAVDLRRNGQAPPSLAGPAAAAHMRPAAQSSGGSQGDGATPQPLLPPNFVGNGVWCLHVPAPGLPPLHGAPSRTITPAATAACCSGASSTQSGGIGAGGGAYVGALRAGAAAVRAALSEMRGRADGGEQLLRAAASQLTAPLSAQVEMMARVCLQQDAMVTCWSAMDYWGLDFGPGAGAAGHGEGAGSNAPGSHHRNRPVQYSGSQVQSSVQFMKKGAFISGSGVQVLCNLPEAPTPEKKDLTVARHNLLSLPQGPLLLRISGDGKALCVVQAPVPGQLQIFDLQALLSQNPQALKDARTLRDHDRPIVALASSSCTNHVASSNAGGTVYLHDAALAQRATLGALSNGSSSVVTPKRCLAFSQTSSPLRLAAGSDDGHVLLWQILPSVSGPVVLSSKMRARVMGVGFGTFNKVPSSVLISCAETGQLMLTDMSTYPKLENTISMELAVSVSCMAVRDDGAVLAIGTKDGRVGVLGVQEAVQHKAKAVNLIRVFDLGTHLEVTDVAFHYSRSGLKDSRDGATSRDSLDGSTSIAAAAAAAVAGSTAAAEVTSGSGSAAAAAAQQLVKDSPNTATSAGAVPAVRQVPTGAATSAGASAAPSSARSSAPVTGSSGLPPTLPGGGSRSGSASMPSAAIPPAYRRSSDSGGLAGLTPPAGAVPTTAVVAVAQEEPAPSAATAPAVIVPIVAAAEPHAGTSTASRGLPVPSSPVGSPSRGVMSPRGAGSVPFSGLPGRGAAGPMGGGAGGGAELLSSNLRSYMDEMKDMMRELVFGLQADMVRQTLANEAALQRATDELRAENQVLRAEVGRLSQQLDAALRFGLLGQQRGPW